MEMEGTPRSIPSMAGLGLLARSPSSALLPTFLWEGSPTKIAYRKKHRILGNTGEVFPRSSVSLAGGEEPRPAHDSHAEPARSSTRRGSKVLGFGEPMILAIWP